MICSFLDILYLGRIFPKRAAIMAKRELQWSPLLGQYRESGRSFVWHPEWAAQTDC